MKTAQCEIFKMLFRSHPTWILTAGSPNYKSLLMELKMSSLLRLSLNKRSEQPGPRHMLSTISSHLVEVPQALDEVVACIRWALGADGLLTRENTLDLQKNNPVLKSKSLFYKRYELSLFICCFQIFFLRQCIGTESSQLCI